MLAEFYDVECRSVGWVVIAMPARRPVLRPMTEEQARRLAASLNRNIGARERGIASETNAQAQV